MPDGPKPQEKPKPSGNTQSNSTPTSLQSDYQRAKMFNDYGLPTRHYSAKMPTAGPWFEHGKTITEKLGTGFLFALVGKRGTGKTLMAVKIILSAVQKSGLFARYETAMNIFLKLRDGYKHNHSELDLIEGFINPPVLAIDAMEVRGETKFENQILDHIIDQRYSSMRDTLLVSNQENAEFIKSAGPSIISRLKETGGIVECNWEGFR